MKSEPFKPLNIQFEIEEKLIADRLRQLADLLGDQRGDRRLRGAAVAKAIVYAAVKRGMALELLGLASKADGARRTPTTRTRRSKSSSV